MTRAGGRQGALIALLTFFRIIFLRLILFRMGESASVYQASQRPTRRSTTPRRVKKKKSKRKDRLQSAKGGHRARGPCMLSVYCCRVFRQGPFAHSKKKDKSSPLWRRLLLLRSVFITLALWVRLVFRAQRRAKPSASKARRTRGAKRKRKERERVAGARVSQGYRSIGRVRTQEKKGTALERRSLPLSSPAAPAIATAATATTQKGNIGEKKGEKQRTPRGKKRSVRCALPIFLPLSFPSSAKRWTDLWWRVAARAPRETYSRCGAVAIRTRG